MDKRVELAKYRLEKAEKCLEIAKTCMNCDDYESAANRSYYSMFHSVRALLALEGIDYSKHSGVLSHFRREYIKTGIFEGKYSEYIGDAFELRTKSDYDDFYVISKLEVLQQVKNADELLKTVKTFVGRHSVS